MDSSLSMNPLASVQLIPVINYLNLLSDFLFVEKSISEYDQHKPIPIINGLYQYFEDHRSNQTLILKLIRSLLLGSDLYGEKENENIDVIFVNTMFDYIISSLVFAKYGNIYGFLADTIRQEENLQFDYILGRVKENLRKAEFENEYGNSSTLTELSVSRIFNDLLMPLFPVSPYYINLLSLDYIFAQAGSTFLRLGRFNETYYTNFQNYTTINFDDGDIFNEYLLIGCIIENLLFHKVMDPLALKVFALPALCHYVSKKQETKNETIEKIIFNPHHWGAAYDYLFTYLDNSFTKIKNQLENDSVHQIHQVFTNFHSRAKFAKLVLDLKCKFLNDHYRETRIPVYIDNADYFKCRSGDVLPNINDWFNDQLHNIGEVYKKHDLEITLQLFKDSFAEDLQNIVINLVDATNNTGIDINFNNQQYLPYDLLELFDINYPVPHYYALVRENYTIRIISKNEEPELFHQTIGPSEEYILENAHRITLKFANESKQQFIDELINYKKDRLKTYLNYSENNLEHDEWWREFGLSLIPYYPCLTNITNNYQEINKFPCEKENIKFLNKLQDSSHLINRKTQNLLLSLGTNLKTVFINDLIDGSVLDELETVHKITLSFLKFTTPVNKIYEKFSQHIEEPNMENSCITQEGINFVSTIIDFLERNINQSFPNSKRMLLKMQVLKTRYTIIVGNITEELNLSLYVNSWNRNVGYGYKFVNIRNKTNDAIILAQLRTSYELKKKIFISLISNLSKSNEKLYRNYNDEIYGNKNNVKFLKFSENSSKLEEILLKYENGKLVPVNDSENLIYEINNQLRREYIKTSFYGISIHNHDNSQCMTDHYLKKTKYFRICTRHWRHLTRMHQNQMIENELLKDKIDPNNLLKSQMFNISTMYNFQNDTDLIHFLNNWLKDKQFEFSVWTKNNVVDKSGLLNKLLYDIRLELENVTIPDGEKRINSIYTYRERCKIEEERTLEDIINDFNDQQAGDTITFEDYYAVRNFAISGYERITRGTREAKLMKNALYKLAIRQSNNVSEEYELKLFYFDSMPVDTFQYQFIKDSQDIHLGKSIILQRFIRTSGSALAAKRIAGHPLDGFRNILYELNFYGPYLRAKIEISVNGTENLREKNVILLPGSEFQVERLAIVPGEKIGQYFKVVLSFKPKINDKYHMFKDIMRQMDRSN
ncbi:uncharacterized protein LOC122506180 [Leptopilina heterotoma]|uniref:uncharacterized protein LOC122506180 n=1 Tax=Leptopilina heterotoma TaxID=63436 RepID=UPI001CA95B28|nr:uncharacterized protein LOC122506180 [Leptopilina heterotoma]